MPVCSSPSRTVPNQQSRRASLPHNLKIPLIKITPRVPVQTRTTRTIQSSLRTLCTWKCLTDVNIHRIKCWGKNNKRDGSGQSWESWSQIESGHDRYFISRKLLWQCPECKSWWDYHLSSSNETVIVSDDVEEDLDSTPDLDEVIQHAHTSAERRNCRKFAEREGLVNPF